MPQLQQLSSHHAAGSAQPSVKHPDAPQPSTASFHAPATPVPRAVLFNTAGGFAYQVMTSAIEKATTPTVSIFTVRRIPVANSRALSLHLAAATSCRLPFCVVEGGVTWSDVVTTLMLPQPERPPSHMGWNVQVLGQDVDSGAWVPITPSLSSRLETRYFLCTDVEVLFGHYQTSVLYMQAVPLTPETAGPDWRTPLQQSSATGAAPPPAPIKAPRQGSASAPSSSASQPRATTDAHTASARLAGKARPCSLSADLGLAAQAPSTPLLSPPSAHAMWSLAAFVKQQERWGRRCQELRQRAAGVTPQEALQQVREELRFCRAAFGVDGVVTPTCADKGVATWALSLLEHQCTTLADNVHAACTEGRNDHQFLLRLARSRLGRAFQLACKVIHVADSVLSAAGAADDAGVVLSDFPRDWLALLLASLRLRSLRHLALARACGAVPNGQPQSSWTMEALVDEAVQTAGWILEALFSICERGEIPGLAQAALAETLLTCALSLAELAAYLSTNTSHRCELMAAAVHVCRVRFQLTRGDGDAHWLPQCVSDVVARMQTKFGRIPLTSSAFTEYAALIRQLRDSAECAEMCNREAAAHAGAPPADVKPEPLPLGYTVTRLPVTAAVDAAFVRGNTLVRELRRTAAAVQRAVQRSSTAPSSWKDPPQSQHRRAGPESTEHGQTRSSPQASEAA
ncbi:conserved hypothetical protein [Leishmania major strain Friedlin]|uniref:Uncharacterized protein n=1 Tax=Leishmania major TaxID=5664 RepID=Q4QFW8_LEIMA|nr:conserved hypothetical protein [Leishmania major strain Friedlin]CAG9571199.1 hypothetical_protein_-_conserved [Leishmania major strain Friedlin]CAJ02646.1 conserved hypothetical protein [Leishmania major strain Friedlin]|eukprot:XP_001687616.1 conserved hypothetical protein [Leishmania major strain Friedlin]